jgi:hypothetical protein
MIKNLKQMVRIHKVSFAITLFLVVFLGIHYTKPTFLYTEEGGFRQFGIGYRNKTVVPIWGMAILLAILSYLFVLYYLAYF